MGIRVRPPGFEVLAFASVDQHNFTPNTSFCVLDVWHSLIRVVVLHLLGRGTNFHGNKQSRNCTQYGLISLRKVRTSWPQRTSSVYFVNSCTCNLFLSGFLFFNFQVELLASKIISTTSRERTVSTLTPA